MRLGQMSHHRHLAVSGLTRLTQLGQLTGETLRVLPQRSGHPGPATEMSTLDKRTGTRSADRMTSNSHAAYTVSLWLLT